ncbi:MAG: putative acetyl xylan esterase [Segetibacter sp.]|nr:putative acetyl xylan esterase [Segetibacter sp.]
MIGDNNKARMKRSLMICCSLFILSVSVRSQNYDELKVPVYTLPEVLKTSGDKTVADKADWEKIRRPQLLTLFADNVYGQMPKEFDNIKFTVKKDDARAMGGKARLKEVEITVWKADKSVKINLVLFLPNEAKKPAPVFLLINNRDKNNTDPGRTEKNEFWPAEMLVDSGYAIAAFHVSDAAPDDKINYITGALLLYPEQLTRDNGMKAIGAWAWAASRVMDYFEKDKGIDAKKVFVVGHSRGGKAALWAGAQDQRFAMVFSNCSGNTGAALARRKYGETISRINTSFPHWFCNNYKKYNDNESALPVDQHMLLSLIAPRPLYVTNASKDLWADPTGTYLSLKNAEPVYALYKKPSVLTAEPPAINSPVIYSTLGYHNREGEHNLTVYDWGNFVRFANYHLKR